MIEEIFSCEKCRQSIYPDDPEIKSGPYHLSGCDYCSYYMSPKYRIEKLEHREIGYAEYADEWNRKQWDIVNQLRGEIRYTRRLFVNTLEEIKEQASGKNKNNFAGG